MVRTRCRVTVGAAFVLASVLLVGISGSANAKAGKVFRGGTITFATTLSPVSMDPVTASSVNSNGDAQYMEAVFDFLVVENPGTGAVDPKLAKSLTSTDGLVWTLKLRPGISFTDGTPLDADAVKFAWDRLADPANKSPNLSYTQTIASNVVVDPLTLRTTLKSVNSQFPRLVAKFMTYVPSPTAIRTLGAKFATAPVGAGPFTFKDWIRDSSMTLVKNPSYWVKGRPYIDTLIIKYIVDPQQRYTSFAAGDTNYIRVLTAYDLIARAHQDGYTVKEIDVPWVYALFLNLAKPPFNDLVARQALDYAIDRQKLNTTVNFGVAPPVKNLYSPGDPFYDPTAKLTQFDPKKAQELFDQYAASHGGPMEFTLNASAASATAMQFIQAQLAQFKNVTVNVSPVLSSLQAVANQVAGNFSVSSGTIGFIDPEPDISTFFVTGATRNYGKYSNPVMDAAIKAGQSTLDLKERAKAYKTVQKLLISEVPAIIFQPFLYDEIVGKNVRGIKYVANGIVLWDGVQIKGGSK